MTGPVLALDLGARRIGLAISDVESSFAFPAGHLERSGLERDLAALKQLVEDRAVVRIVIGLPLHMDGREGSGAAEARAFANQLARVTARPVETLDERWTSLEAERALRPAPRRRRQKKGASDAIAATLLLRTFLARASTIPSTAPGP